MIKFPLVLTIALLFLTSHILAFSWSSCTEDEEILRVSSVVMAPTKPDHSTPRISITISGKLSQSVSSGLAQTRIKMGPMRIFNNHIDLCDIKSCPIQAGNFAMTVVIPYKLPKGHFIGDTLIIDKHGNEIACLNFDFRI
eukprot:gene13839-16318_t